MTSKDIDQLALRYTQILNEGFFDRFKKKPQEPETNNQPERKVEDEKPVYIDILGTKTKMSYDSLMYDSEVVETIGQEPNYIELKMYKTSRYDSPGRDFEIFIPVVVQHVEEDYPRPRIFIAAVGRGMEKKEPAIQELNRLGAKYRKNSNNS